MNLKRLFIVAILIFPLSRNGYSTVTVSANPISLNTISVNLPLKKEQMRQQLQWFVNLTVKDYEKLKGKKLNFFERVSLKLNQHRAKQMLKHYDWDEPTTLQKISWFIKGLLFGPIALILGYIFLKDEMRELIKWIWFGFAGWCIILVLILLAASA